MPIADFVRDYHDAARSVDYALVVGELLETGLVEILHLIEFSELNGY